MKIDKRLAIIDLGSNSVRMNIMGIGEDNHYVLLDQAKEKVRLSEGMGLERLIRSVPLERLLATLDLFRQLIDAYGITEVHALATAALRMAANQEQVLDIIEAESGFRFQIVSGEEEAALDWLGVANTMALENAFIIDLGGASTEIILMEQRKLVASHSMPYGSVNLSENYSQQEAKQRVMRELDRLEWLKGRKHWPFVGVGGTIRTLAKMDRIQRRWPLFHVHNYHMTYADIEMQLKRLASTPQEKIKELAGVSQDRADLMKVGVTPFRLLFERIKPRLMNISFKGIREGQFFKEYFGGDRGEVLEDVLDFSVRNLQQRYEVNQRHAEYVARMSERFFDLLDHDFTSNDRKILTVAARLHDIGMYIDYYSHHQHGFYLMMESGLYGLSDEELIEAAILIGKHRQKPLNFDLSPYLPLIGRERYHRLEKLSLFLNVAEQLDRSEGQKVADIRRQGHELCIMMRGSQPSMLEQKAAEQGIRKLQQIFRCHIRFDCMNIE